MKPLKERLKERAEKYREEVKTEKITESILELLGPELRPSITGNVYELSSFLYLSTDDLETFEEKTLPSLSEKLNVRWERTVASSAVSYSTSLTRDGRTIYITVYAKPTNSCRIIAVPTGRMTTKREEVSFEVPEIEYFIDCGEE